MVSTLQGYERRETLSGGRIFDVYRATDPAGVPVVVKTPSSNYPEPSVLGRLQHEHDLLASVSLPGVVAARDLFPVGVSLALVMDDAGDCLGDAVPLSTGPFLHVALQLARAVGGLHLRDIIHRDLNPSNIVLTERDGRLVATLVDFGLAVHLASVPDGPQRPDRLEGTLPYLAPEQTGRMHVGVDHRSDLYALGATFYTMLVGQPPFPNQDPLELIHAHLARVAIPPHERVPGISPTLSTIVMKLLEKAPEARYQTAEGLAHDLETALLGWEHDARVPRFPLALRDTPRMVRIPDRLYGRDAQRALLASALTAAAGGEVQVALISGAAGLGKSALARTLDPLCAALGARFSEGKFEALRRDVPFSALGQALGGVIRQILASSAASVATWRTDLDTRRTSMIVAAQVVPELHLLLNQLPAPPEVGDAEAATRTTMALGELVQALASPNQPLVLFLDDLQWADPASLTVLERVALADDAHHLLLVGSWRPAEVDADHPLTATLRAWDELEVLRIELGPLSLPAVSQLVADSLRLTPDAVGPLAQAILHSTGGNPFFARRLLRELCRRGVVYLDVGRGQWAWDEPELANLEVADNVADFLASSLDRLPSQTLTVFESAAIMGASFELGALSRVVELDRSAVVEALWPAVGEGFLVPLDGAERLPRGGGLLDERFAGLTASWRFIHDRVHEAAYARIPAERRPSLHRRVGRALLDAGNDLDERLFQVVEHLSAGRHCLADDAERRQFLDLALRAGRRAVASASHDVARRHAAAAAEVLPSDATPAERFGIARAQATFAYLSGDHASAVIHMDDAEAVATTVEQRCQLLSLRVVQATVAGNYAEALDWGRQGLALLGHPLPDDDLDTVTDVEQGELAARLSTRVEAVLDLPNMTDSSSLATMSLLSQMAAPAYIAQPALFGLIPTRMALLSLEHGNAAQSAYAYAFCGMLRGTQASDWPLGFAMGTAGVELARRMGDPTETCRTLHTFGSHVNHWGAHVRTSRPLLTEAHRAGVASGDLQFASYAYTGLVIHWYVSGVPLDDVLADCDACIAFARRTHNQVVTDMQVSYRQAICALQGGTASPTSMDGGGFGEAAFVESLAGRFIERTIYEIRKLELTYLHGDLVAAQTHAKRAHEGLAHVAGLFVVVELAFYEAMTCTGLALQESGPRAGLLETARAVAGQLDQWARACPENFAHLRDLVNAEIARVEDRPLAALDLYAAACEGARNNGFLQYEALAAQRAADFHHTRGWELTAQANLRASAGAWRRWGAHTRADALESTRPEIFVELPGSIARSRQRSWSTNRRAVDELSLLKSAEAIAGEVVRDDLLRKLLRIVLEAAGARRGAIILEEADGPFVHGVARRGGAEVILDRHALGAGVAVPVAIVQFVRRTRKLLVLNDASASGLFVHDPEVRARKTRSVLCLPILKGESLMAVLCMENELAAGAFTPGNVEILRLLSSQIAIALDNSRLFEDLRRENAERQRAETALMALNAELELRVQERTAALEASNIDLARSNKELEQFAYIASHDLRAPLRTVTSFSELIRDGYGSAMDDRGRQYLDFISDGAGRMKLLIDDLLEYARVGRAIGNAGPVSLQPVLDEVLADLRATLDETGAEVVHDALPTVRGHRPQISQVLHNLLGNALKYRGTDVPRVQVRCRREGAMWEISVTDNGAGIDPKHHDTVFQIFRRVSRDSEGTGIGLALVSKIVEGHGGRVGLESALGSGSTFRFTLPAAD